MIPSGRPNITILHVTLSVPSYINTNSVTHRGLRYCHSWSQRNGVMNYFLEQWLLLRLLGGSPCPTASKDTHKAWFVNKCEYVLLLDTVFGNCTTLMCENSYVYVRIDSREFTLRTTLDALRKSFPYHHIAIKEKLVADNVKTQTQVCINKSNRRGEADIVPYSPNCQQIADSGGRRVHGGGIVKS